MAMQKKLWSINGLANELGMDRRTLSKKLEDLKPAVEKKRPNRVDRKWYLNDVVAHLNRPKKQLDMVETTYRFTESELTTFNEEVVKEFIATEFIPKTIDSPTFFNTMINGMSEMLGISNIEALTAYKIAVLSLVSATAKGFKDEGMEFKFGADGTFSELSDLGDEAFSAKYF